MRSANLVDNAVLILGCFSLVSTWYIQPLFRLLLTISMMPSVFPVHISLFFYSEILLCDLDGKTAMHHLVENTGLMSREITEALLCKAKKMGKTRLF